MTDLKIVELLNAAGYRVEFQTLPKDGMLPAGPGVALRWENNTMIARGVDSSDALRGAARYVVTEVEAKRIDELTRRGVLHAALTELLGKGR